jgi:energy-coupling factor transporter transmembrane protein EcfT
MLLTISYRIFVLANKIDAHSMSNLIKPQHMTTLLSVFVFFFVFARACEVQGQISTDLKPDTLSLLNGHVNILLKAGTYDTMKTEQLIQMYSLVFNSGQVISTRGFKFSENSNLRFYQTSLENHVRNDGGLSTWKLIESFTNKIPQGLWMESKWEAHAGGYWYFVKLASREKPAQFFKFIFFYVDGKLAFCVHEYVVDPLQASEDNSDPQNYLSYVYANTHPSRYISFEKK